ncbi:hypothetical protein V8E53_010349 [Lactarius tabidus]
MPTSSAGQTGEKKTTSAAQPQPAQPSPSPVTGEPNKAKQPSKYIEACKYLSVNQLLPEGATCSPRSGTDTCLGGSLTNREPIQGCTNALEIPGMIKEMQGNFSKELEQKLNALENKLTASPPASDLLETASKEIEQAVQSIKAVAGEMGKSIVQVTDTSMQLASTATNYKDTLLKSSEQQAQPRPHPPQEKPSQSDPKVIRDIDRKARQILIDTKDDKLLSASLAEIKEKVHTAISAITNPPPPKEATILEISKLCKGGFTILFKEKEITDWLQDPNVESEFTAALAEDTAITKCTFPIMVPCIPLTFDPSEEGHLMSRTGLH